MVVSHTLRPCGGLYWLCDKLIVRLIGGLIVRLVYRLVGRLIVGLIDRLIGRLGC
jgi:hypothetical protein